jgi:uncharacterized membrane protein
MTESYQLWKTAHVVGATIVFGTGLGIAFFCWVGSHRAIRDGDMGALRSMLRLTEIADYCFTAPAVAFQLGSGMALMHLLGWPWVSPWSLVVLALFALAGACWLPVVGLQHRLAREASRAASIAALSPAFHRWFRWWFALGIVAFAAVIGLLYLMAAKPLPLSFP